MKTLYEELGGRPTIEMLVTSFYQNVLSDPVLLPFFESTSIDKLQSMQVAFFCVALGGPAPDKEFNLYQIHQGMGIEVKHLSRFTEHLLKTLQEIGIEEDRSKRVFDRIARYANEILGDSTVDG